MSKSVSVIGAGVTGLTAAHELIQRDFTITVYESSSIIGGKSRSVSTSNPKQWFNSQDIPGEHSFRFFPGFYQHLDHTLRRIPYKSNPNGVLDNLVCTTHSRLSRLGQADAFLADDMSEVLEILIPFFQGRKSFKSISRVVKTLYEEYPDDGSHLNLALSEEEWENYSNALRLFMTGCPERRLEEFEKISWWEFINASKFS